MHQEEVEMHQVVVGPPCLGEEEVEQNWEAVLPYQVVVLPLVAAVPPYQVVEAHPFVEVEMVVVVPPFEVVGVL